ncbi:MAG: hypothetical protein IPM32_18205 [Ignavibacteriae bacterium]|nr:hypothetical protein [Ignavibacteriota bacterium]
MNTPICLSPLLILKPNLTKEAIDYLRANKENVICEAYSFPERGKRSGNPAVLKHYFLYSKKEYDEFHRRLKIKFFDNNKTIKI